MKPARILAVCTGNVCRSPFTERVLTARLRVFGLDESHVLVRSAGTHAMVGDPMTEPTRRLVADHDAEPGGFVSRQLLPAMVQEVDLVLALTREHRTIAVQMFPRANRYTFTLRQLERLLALAAPELELSDGDDPRKRIQAVIAAAAAKRGFEALSSPELDDVVDPYRAGKSTYATAAGQMVPGIDALAAALS